MRLLIKEILSLSYMSNKCRASFTMESKHLFRVKWDKVAQVVVNTCLVRASAIKVHFIHFHS